MGQIMRRDPDLFLNKLTGDWREREPLPAPDPPRWTIIISTVVVAILLALGCAKLL